MDWYILLAILNPFFPILLPLYLIYRPPPFLIAFLQRRFPDVLFSCKTDEKIAALTIDDAPSSYTADLLAVLSKYDAKATFFCIGSQMMGNEKILEDIVLAGHELGNHAMRDEPSFKLPALELTAQIIHVDSMICSVYESLHLSPPAKYFRPGSGFFNSSMRKLTESLGYRLVLGSVYPHDPQISNPTINSWHITTMAREGAIIIVHDRRGYTRSTLEKSLERLNSMGYKLVSLTELIERSSNRRFHA